MQRISVNDVIREALFVKWQACGGIIEETDVQDTMSWLFGTPMGKHRVFQEVLCRSILHGIDIEKVRSDMEQMYVERVSAAEFKEMTAN